MSVRLVAVVAMVGALVLPVSIAGADSGSGSFSGSASRLYAVDPRTGRTVGTTTYRADTVDVEALAPAGRNAVWGGDRSGFAGGDPWLMWTIPAVIVIGAVGIGLGLRRRSE